MYAVHVRITTVIYHLKLYKSHRKNQQDATV